MITETQTIWDDFALSACLLVIAFFISPHNPIRAEIIVKRIIKWWRKRKRKPPR